MLALLQSALADRYAVERELGRGGMASVWLARDLRHDRPLAIKVLHPELAGVIGVDRFIREIRVTARLQHPNIVPVFDSGTFTGPGGIDLPWYAMAYVPGESLRARLDRERQLPIDDALRIAEETASALDAAHRDGIVHRDIKPENLLLSGGRTYVADFGIAKALVETGGDRLTSSGLIIGTPAYMSPEQATGDNVDARTDQYSLATVVYEMLAGEPPFPGRTAQAIMARRMTEAPRPIHPVRPSVPAPVEGALQRALQRVAADRYPLVSDFSAALRSGTEPRLAAGLRNPDRLRVVGVGALLVAIALVGWWLVAERRKAVARPRAPELTALVQRGTLGFDRRTPEGIRDAIQAFSAAIRRDSSYAEAWAGLAKTYARAYERRFVFPGVARDSVVRLAVGAVERALALDPASGDAWVTRAMVAKQVDPTDASMPIAAVRRGIALDSSNAVAWHVLALNLAESGDLPASFPAWRRAVMLAPGYAQGVGFLALGHYWARQYDSAASWADSTVSLDPTYLLGRSTAGQVAVEHGNFPRARAAFQAAQRLSSDIEVVNSLAGAAFVEGRSGARVEALRFVRRADSIAGAYLPIPLHTAIYLGQAWVSVGDGDSAIAWLSRYSPREDLHFQLHLRCDPPFDPIASDARFKSLLTRPRPIAPSGC